MKIFAVCPECLINNSRQMSYGIGNLQDKGYVKFLCEKGHTSYLYLQEFKFEVLFHQAVRHYCNTEYETSIMLFANSLERFYEFFIKMFIRQATKNDEYVNKKLIKSINLTERQIGAYKMCYYLMFNKEARDFKYKDIRNNVVHNGLIVNKEICYNFANEVFKIIIETLKMIKEKDDNLIINEILKKSSFVYNDAKENNIKLLSTISNFTTFTALSDFENVDLDMIIDSVYRFEQDLLYKKHNQRQVAIDLLEDSIKFVKEFLEKKYSNVNFLHYKIIDEREIFTFRGDLKETYQIIELEKFGKDINIINIRK